MLTKSVLFVHTNHSYQIVDQQPLRQTTKTVLGLLFTVEVSTEKKSANDTFATRKLSTEET